MPPASARAAGLPQVNGCRVRGLRYGVVEARVAELVLEREIYLVRATGRAETRAARAFVDFAKERLA